jgi:CHAT domain-containing protein
MKSQRIKFPKDLLQTLPTNSVANCGRMHVPVNIGPRRVSSLQMSVRDRDAIRFEKNLRLRTLPIVALFVALIAGGCGDSPQSELADEYSSELQLIGDQPVVVTRSLQPGTYLVELRERGIDARTTIDAANTHAELDDAIPRHGVQFKVVRLAAPTILRVAARSIDHRSRISQVLLRIKRWERTSGKLSDLEQGYAAFASAGEQTARGKPESWSLAAESLHQASTHFAAAGSNAARAQAEYALGNLQYLLRSQWQPAILAADAAADAYATVDDSLGEHRAAVLRASAELEIADGMSSESQRAEQRALYDNAEQRLAAAAEYFRAHDAPIDETYAVNMRGIRFNYTGDDDEAWKYFSIAAEQALANRDARMQTLALNNLAAVSNRRGNIVRAASEYARLIPLIERDREQDFYANVIANYGRCLIALGDFDRALSLHTEALQMFAARGDDKERARQLTALGGVYFRIGNLQRALETLRAAIALHQRTGDGSGQASALRMAGNAAAGLGDHNLALDYLRQSAKLEANPQSIARTRVLIAEQLRASGNLAGAQREISGALTSTSPLTRADALTERAQQRRARQDLTSAVADLRAAETVYVSLGLDFNRIETSTILSQTLLALRDVPGATAAADEAVKLERRIRSKSANPEWRARFLATRYAPYEARIAAEIANGRDDDVEASWRAFRTAEDVRARSLADKLAGNRGAAEGVTDPTGDALRARLTAQQLRLEGRVLRQEVDEKETTELRRTIEETRAQIDANWLQQHGMRGDSRRGAELDESLQRVQHALPADTAVLAYFVGDDRSHSWLLQRDRLQHVTLAGRKELQKSVEVLVNEQRHQGSATTSELTGARSVLLGKILDGLQASRLLVLPDGPLNRVPFAALSISAREPSVLIIDRVVLGYAPSLALALSARATAPTRRTRVAVVSDPVYASDDQRLMLAASASDGVFRGARAASQDAFTRLPFSALEARAVASALDAPETILLSGFDATPTRVLGLPRDDLAVLHFATHAAARRDAPEQSALYLTEYANDGSPLVDSRVTASDIARTGLRADLVVLSGCATGDGGELRGEGVLGLTYDFLANGSRSVVASLWPIQDASTARFMTEFYRAYRFSGRTAEALREAQLRMRGRASPAIWSSFVVRANGFP